MPGRWSEDWRDRGYRSGRDDRDEDERYGSRDEGRSWGREDRVFGEDDTGAGYNRPRGERSYSRAELERGSDWQDRDYGGVSPAMRRGEYDTGYRAAPRGARAFGRDEGFGGTSRGRYDQDYDAMRRDIDERRRRTFSGGTGGYDYERGYGDGGRERHLSGYGSGAYDDRDTGRGREGGRDFEDHARDAGDFLRRTGEKVKSWFSDMGRDDDDGRFAASRGARGLGPKGYKRSDERISEEVHQRLTDDSWLDASNINVSVSGGEVTLSGTVDSREAKHRAERVVEDLSGVNHVQNNLRIQTGGYFTSAGRGFGDSVQEDRMRRDDGSTGGNGFSDDSAATRTTTRRT
ncbi:MAG: BON domain-containing protein [Phenylobacterium sp.]|uniref:BON domain-containing protein n=1 Tax=Phenylobacterium sp. TaxID=1871053 RepID=UPI001A532195|nr:BON domain-containing protein [Phenylobacterium sp.]MBL8771976.1 BON domain-containing protein [Phenylobacterium sp.]